MCFFFGAADFVCALAFECGHGQRVAFDAVIAAPGVKLDGALAIDLVALFQRCGGRGGGAEHVDLHPLQIVIAADTDAQPNPWLAGLEVRASASAAQKP